MEDPPMPKMIEERILNLGVRSPANLGRAIKVS